MGIELRKGDIVRLSSNSKIIGRIEKIVSGDNTVCWVNGVPYDKTQVEVVTVGDLATLSGHAIPEGATLHCYEAEGDEETRSVGWEYRYQGANTLYSCAWIDDHWSYSVAVPVHLAPDQLRTPALDCWDIMPKDWTSVVALELELGDRFPSDDTIIMCFNQTNVKIESDENGQLLILGPDKQMHPVNLHGDDSLGNSILIAKSHVILVEHHGSIEFEVFGDQFSILHNRLSLGESDSLAAAYAQAIVTTYYWDAKE